MVHGTYWDQIKHEKRPVGATHMSYCKWLENGLVTTQEQLERGHKEDGALSTVPNLNTTSSYPYVHLSHPMAPTTTSPQATNAYNLTYVVCNPAEHSLTHWIGWKGCN